MSEFKTRRTNGIFAVGQGQQKCVSVTSTIWQALRSKYGLRSFFAHVGAWLLVGVAFGLLLVNDMSWVSVFAFCLAGCVVCSILSILTYPLSEHPHFTLIGALAGFSMTPLYSLLSADAISSFGIQICLIIGALIGGTALVWLSPLRLLTWGRCYLRG